MKVKIYFALFISIFFLLSTCYAGSWVAFNSSQPVKCKPVVHAISETQTEVEISLPGFYKNELQTPSGNAFSISIPGGARSLDAGLPDLSIITFSLVIPDDAEMKVEILSSKYSDINLNVAPSKGNLMRDINPSQVPFSYSSQYSKNEFYPSEIATLRDPYILRDYRGQTVVVNPFQYNPVTQTLRVYYSIKIRVYQNSNNSTINVLHRNHPLTNIDAVFAPIYKNRFVNSNVINYVPVFEHGNMLILSDAAFISSMQPFVNWKNKMGQKTEIVDISTVGTDPTDIKTYIENYYNTNGLTYVLLVGDGPQIAPYPSQWGDSDPSYGFLTGNDTYSEVFVGRFSATTTAQVNTQVQRTMNYEMTPDLNGQWYHKGVCIGSDQGPGDDNELDFEHERNMRTDLVGYLYSDVDELYDGSQGQVDATGDPNAQDLINSLDAGKGIVLYTGHGSSSSLGTTGFSKTDVASLQNYDQLPFIWSVACVNGNFKAATCLAEALMRSVSASGEARGAIATLMSTINQSWNPPMDAQDEMVDILVESYPANIKHTFGGISESGCMHMNDQYGTAGDDMTATWNLFGDPSLMVRTNIPAAMTISHSFTIDVNQLSFPINCSTDGALICMSYNNQIISTGWAMSGSCALLPTGLSIGDTLDIVVTAYNKIPYYGKVVVTNNSTGISSLSGKSFSVYPNPANNFLQFNLPFNMKNVSVQIIDRTGKTVLVGQTIQNKLDISSLAKGIYSVVVFNEEKVFGTDVLLKQ
jgi:hypothetical protein